MACPAVAIAQDAMVPAASPAVTAGTATSTSPSDIVVTAQRREETVFNVPMGLTAIGADSLSKQNINSIAQLQNAVPELTVFTNKPYGQRLFLRGIGESGGLLAETGLYLDEYAVSGVSARPLDLSTFDVQRVEVLYGPQGTLYGQGSEGGTVRFITNDPTLDGQHYLASGDFSAIIGGALAEKFVGMANVPLGQTLAVRASGTVENDGGWINASTAGKTNVNGSLLYNIRLKVLWQPFDNVSLVPIAVVYRDHTYGQSNGEDANGNLPLTPFAPTFIPQTTDVYKLFGLTAKARFGDVQILNAVSGYKNVVMGGYDNMFKTTYRYFNENDDDSVFSEEFRVSSAGSSPFHWTVGAFYREDSFVSRSLLTSGTGATPTLVNYPSVSIDRGDSISVYGNANYDLTDRLEFGGGVRYFSDWKNTDNASVAGGIQRASFNSFDPRVYVAYTIVPGIRLFADWAKGFRSGGFNVINSAFPSAYQPEKVYSTEGGIKYQLFGSVLTGELTYFHSIYKNMQLADISSSVGLGFTTNVGAAKVDGIDWAIRVNVRPFLSFGSSGNRLWADVTQSTPTAALYVGDPINYIPSYNYTLFAEQKLTWSPRIATVFRIDYLTKDHAQYTLRTANVLNVSDTIHMLNMSATTTVGRYDFQLYGQNVLNDRGRLTPSVVGFSPRSQPVTIGMRVTARFD